MGSVLGALMYPGFILTLDVIAVPEMPFPVPLQGVFVGSMPIRWVLYLVNGLVPGWMLQKLVLLALFALVLGCAHRFLHGQRTHRVTRFFSSFFFLVNPFVYTRFLAGHWMHLFAYALLPWVWHQSLQLAGLREGLAWKRTWAAPALLGVSLAIVSMFSLHVGVMALTMVVIVLAGGIRKEGWKAYLENALLVLATFIIATSYWTLPYVYQVSGTILEQFTERHWMAYRTAGSQAMGALGHVLSLYGFWGEAYPWAAQFRWPWMSPWLWGVSGFALAALVVAGIVLAFQQTAGRRHAWLMLGVCLVAVVFSCGVGDSPFYAINYWLFEHVGFWRGFRDSQKWSALIVLAYAFFGGLGMEQALRASRNAWVRRAVGVVGVLAVFAYTWPMLGGFWGQLRPVWYPASWTEANAVFSRDPNCVAVFLPWHGYQAFGFTNNILIANPAGSFFHCRMVLTRQVELGSISVQSVPDPAYDAIDGVMTGRDGWLPDDAVKVLRSAGIRYVIASTDTLQLDPWSYGFIHSSSVRVEKSWPDLTLYRIVP